MEIKLKRRSRKEFKKTLLASRTICWQLNKCAKPLFTAMRKIINPIKHRKMNEAYLQMFVDMYRKQFTVGRFKTS